ncbi:MAG: hypothetical protein IIC01_02045 [Planctomycetes bacterium]|nr:hypothetical protein [Planctomycetota bacterium]
MGGITARRRPRRGMLRAVLQFRHFAQGILMSTVIKAGMHGKVLRRLTTVDLADHLSEARQVIENARRQGAEIVAQAHETEKRLYSEACQSGYENGYAKGRETGTLEGREAAHAEAIERFQRDHADIVSDMRRVVEEMDRIKQDLRIAAEQDLLDFAVLLARKLTFAIGRLNHEAVIENLKRALDRIASRTDVTVRIHSDDLATMTTFAESTLDRVRAAAGFSIVADDSIAPGGCIVESERTDVDASLETQVEEMVSLLTRGHTDHA